MPDSLRDLTQRAIAFRDARDWAQFHRPKDLALGLAIEAGELGELFLWKTEAETDAVRDDPAFRRRLLEEMGDVQIFLLYLAHRLGVDLGEAVVTKLATNERKYPADRFRGTSKKYDELT
jgi:NTP pyrophosphatase (non-canonical NTP hydrolase)